MENILNQFRLNSEKEDFEKVIENVESGVEFKGTNLWILVFAIFIASLGLNVNSTAVVIGAMLVSPLMGPIMGLGMGMAINDLSLLRKALYNYVFALVVGLITSTIFFSLSPVREASSEILARTSPNIYDVLIALFGGFAGILAVSSRKKANVIPGVAIATALMPPLCTAGYGIANWNFTYFSGAMYLFVINTVFIALATLVTARFLQFPHKHLLDEKAEVMAKRIVWGVVILTLLPSIYFGYDIVQQNRFRQNANQFIDREAIFPNDYLLKKTIDAKAKTIKLTYGGALISETEIDALKAKLPQYNLEGIVLDVVTELSARAIHLDRLMDQASFPPGMTPVVEPRLIVGVEIGGPNPSTEVKGDAGNPVAGQGQGLESADIRYVLAQGRAHFLVGIKGQDDVVLLLQVGGVVDDHAESARQAEEDLSRRRQPGLRVAEGGDEAARGISGRQDGVVGVTRDADALELRFALPLARSSAGCFVRS